MYSREIEMSRFDELPLSPEVLKGIRKMRFTQMTPIQIEAIPLLLEGRDITVSYTHLRAHET